MKKFFSSVGKILAFVALTLVLAAALAAGGLWFLRGELFASSSTVEIDSDFVGERLESVHDLVTVEYYYKNVSRIERSQIQLWGVSVPFTGSRAIFSYEGVLKYGLDVSQVTVEVSGRTVTLTLPPSKVISHEIPEKSIEIFDDGRNVFNPITIKDYVEFQTEQKAKVEAEARERSMPETARQKAGETLVEMLTAIPDLDGYKITFQ